MITHTLNSIPKTSNDIIITTHCIEQVFSRFKLFIPKNFHNSKDLPIYVKDCILKGNINRKFEFSPFYVNKCKSKFEETIIINTKLCVFIARWDKKNKNKLVVKTAVKRP